MLLAMTWIVPIVVRLHLRSRPFWITRLRLLTLISRGQALDDRVGRSIGLCGVVAVIGPGAVWRNVGRFGAGPAAPPASVRYSLRAAELSCPRVRYLSSDETPLRCAGRRRFLPDVESVVAKWAVLAR
jgi:hypothetical protein